MIISKKLSITSKSKKRLRPDVDQSHQTINCETDEYVFCCSVESRKKMTAHAQDLIERSKQMTAIAENIILCKSSTSEKNSENKLEKTSGKLSKMECGIAITLDDPVLHDVRHIVNDDFRDHLCRDLPGDKSQFFDSLELKEHFSLIEDIRNAEKDVMDVQERILKASDNIELIPQNVENYSLLCPRVLFGDYGVKNYGKRGENTGCPDDHAEKKTVYGIHDELRRLRLQLNKERPNFMIRIKNCVTKIGRKLPMAEKSKETNLFVNTNIVRFSSFEPGSIYKKTVLIANTGQRMVTFKMIYTKTHRYLKNVFVYELSPRCPIATGMNAKLTITFQCTSMEDVYEFLTMVASDDKKTNVLVCAENAVPLLKYTVESYDMDLDFDESVRQNGPTTNVFECNACLVGATKTTVVKVTNIGRSAKFVCLSEDVWYTKPVEDVEWDTSLSLGAFRIKPSIFEINKGQSIEIKVEFVPSSPSFYCSRFIILSDNSCAKDVNVFGDGQMFDGRNIWLEGQDIRCRVAKSTVLSYYLELGKIGNIVRCMNVKNTSRIAHQYHWVINHAIVKPGSKNAKVNFSIHPSTGLLDKHSETMFRVECSVTDEIIYEQLEGKNRVIATLMIDDIPKESINGREIFFEEQQDSSEFLSVRMAEIEFVSDYVEKERIPIKTDPVIVDLNWYNLNKYECAKKSLDFINDGSLPVRVNRVKGDDGSSVITVEPESFEVTNRKRVSLLIEPKCPGRLREVLRFRTENQDGDVSEVRVYVRGNVGQTPELRIQGKMAQFNSICTGMAISYGVHFDVKTVDQFSLHRRLYEFNASGTLNLYSDVKSFGPYGNGSKEFQGMRLYFETPVKTEAGGISCQLAEWSLAGSTTVLARTRTVTYARKPDVRLNVNAFTIARPLYKGVSRRAGGIRLLNNTHCDWVYSWGSPTGRDANNADCVFEPANGTVNGGSSVEFEFIVTPKKTGHFDKFYVPCFIQCDALNPLRVKIKCHVKEFIATISYQDPFNGWSHIVWQADQNHWIVNSKFSADADQIENEETEDIYDLKTTYLNSYDEEILPEYEIESENQESSTWHSAKRLNTLSMPGPKQFGRVPDNPVMVFKDVECNTATERRIVIRNPTDVLCHVKSNVGYYGCSISDQLEEKVHGGDDDKLIKSKKYCTISIDKDDMPLCGQDELEISVQVLATVWGQYNDDVIIELRAGSSVLPLIHIPLVVEVVTFPIEYPLATDIYHPTVKFSLYAINVEQRLQVLNNSEIPVQLSWRIYNKSEQNKPFGVILDMLTPDIPNNWSLRINRYYGSEWPKYFKIKPVILKLGPKQQGFVTFSLDRMKEKYVNRDENNKVYGKAVGIVTSLEHSGINCTRKDEFKMKSTIVNLLSETRHSIQPNLVIRESDTIFRISATQVYNSQLPIYTVSRLFTMVNLLRYPTNILFDVDKPFAIKSLRTLRCGSCPGNTNIRVFYNDLIEIEIIASIVTRKMYTHKITSNAFRKYKYVGYLYAVCENSYFKPKAVAQFEAQIHFPVLNLSTNNINFGEVVVGETKSIDVMLSSCPGPESFVVSSYDEVFEVSPTSGVTSRTPILITITFRPIANVWYSRRVEILTTIPNDAFSIDVSGSGVI